MIARSWRRLGALLAASLFTVWILGGGTFDRVTSRALAEGDSLAEQIRSNDLAIAFPAIASRAAELRGLAPRTDVPRAIQTPDEFRARLLDDLNRPEGLQEIEQNRKLLVALGLVASDVDLYALELQFRTGVVLGQYDPDTKQLYVITNASTLGLVERVTLAHEYTHALQDQYYDIRALMPRDSDNSDRDLAVSALLEGDAVIMEGLFQAQVFTAAERAEKRREEQALSSGLDLDRLPLVMREETYFPYLEGPQFIVRVAGQEAMRQVLQTGTGYGPLVNRMFEHPPHSTSQILHPDKYLNGVDPIEVQLPNLAVALGDGWTQLRKDVLGEIDHRILVQQFVSRELGEHVSAGWAGDAFALLGKGDQIAVVLRARWNTTASAADWLNAYAQVMQSRYGARQQVLERQADRIVWRTPDGLQALRQADLTTTLIVANTEDELARLEQVLGAGARATAVSLAAPGVP